jgi:hypothetical protein
LQGVLPSKEPGQNCRPSPIATSNRRKAFKQPKILFGHSRRSPWVCYAAGNWTISKSDEHADRLLAFESFVGATAAFRQKIVVLVSSRAAAIESRRCIRADPYMRGGGNGAILLAVNNDDEWDALRRAFGPRSDCPGATQLLASVWLDRKKAASVGGLLSLRLHGRRWLRDSARTHTPATVSPPHREPSRGLGRVPAVSRSGAPGA